MPAIATFFEAVLQGAVDLLDTLPGIPADHVHAERPVPFDKADCPALNVSLGDGRFETVGSEGADSGLLRATVELNLRLHLVGSPQTLVAAPLVGQVHAALMADPSLGGIARRLRLASSHPSQAAGDGTVGTYELSYEATVAVDERTLAAVVD